MSDSADDFIIETELKGVFVIKRPTFEDDRGFFRELYRKGDLEKRLGYEFTPVQPNHSRSKKDTLRAIHVATWHKLVTVMRGEVQQLVADLREDSPTFGKHITINVGDSNRVCVFIPAGCGNGFLALSDEVDYCYFTTDYWGPGKEKYVIYNDPDLNINWQTQNPIVSEKDSQSPKLREVFPDKFK
jgi:dTDP-4-dehydrorhamnose 3,5-epimerase